MSNTKKSFGKFILLWSGGFVSAIGSGLTSFGLGVYVYQQTKSASAMALVTLLAFLPSLLLSAFAGVLADRYDRRMLMILGDSLSALGILFILICIIRGEAQLWQICVGVTISSIFSSLLDPSYKATITDLLTKEEYTKASGLVQVSNSAKFLISPILAGFLLTISDIKLLLIVDICTIFVTVLSTLAVKKGLESKKIEQKHSFKHEFKDGWKVISENKGLLALVVMGSVITFFVGFIQILSSPMVLSFSDSSVLGTTMTICASGMLVTSLFLGFVPLKKNYAKTLSVALFLTGVFMGGFGLRENIILICIFGFLFFAMLPFANTCLDYLIRTNIGNAVQGRVWGLVGILSQLGYVAAYVLSGLLADFIFTPLLLQDGMLANSIGQIIGIGNGRGTGLLIIIAGLMLCVTSLVLYRMKSVKNLESQNKMCTNE